MYDLWKTYDGWISYVCIAKGRDTESGEGGKGIAPLSSKTFSSYI